MKTSLFIILCIVWGSTWTAIKLGLQDAPPIWSSGMRITLAGFILLAYNYLKGNSYPAGWREKWRVAWLGILMYGLSYFLVYWAVQYISSALASILFASFPFFIIIYVPIFIKDEKNTLKSIIGVITGFIGIIIIFAGPISLDSNTLTGAALVIIATASSAYCTVHIKAFLRDQPIFPMMAMQMTIGGVLTLIVAALTEDLARFNVTALSVGSIVYLATFGSVLTFGGYYWLLTRINTLKLSLIAFITPIIAILLGYMILDEVLTVQDGIGSALVLAGVLLAGTRD
jgi:drug/metabolite transporter (DMT)-like permease